ncbi:MAG: phosphoribosyl-ATP diphosphatase [Clostridiales bacterium]|jgi:phosphoribosyl-ATP pyrophosphohydrolase|nr:phosphoribosyl-ATP diphosphatase [Clostridiales bacterium]
MADIIKSLYKVIEDRKKNPFEESYTCYLFGKGTDKILKKIGEECAEVIIAAKNRDNTETVNEICDLIYHVLVLTVNANIPLENVFDELEKRSRKIGNLKQQKDTDKLT